MPIWLTGCLLLLLIYLLAGVMLSFLLTHIRRQTLPEAYEWQSAHYDISWYEGLAKKDFIVRSYDGYSIHAQLLSNAHPSGKYVIISHGYTDNRYGALKYAKAYLELGFHVIIYDLRGHGANQKTFCSYSVREAKDLNSLIQYCRQEIGNSAVLGIHGESLGAATSIACLKYAPNIQFAVSDCGFSEIISIFTAGIRQQHLPVSLLKIASFILMLRSGIRFEDMRPIDSLNNNRVPVMYIHGANDSFIVPDHSVKMSEATKSYCEIHLIPEAGHAQSALIAPEQYKKFVHAFLRHIIPDQSAMDS